MAKNQMEEIAKLLGVELGEKFIVKNSERIEEVVLYKGGLLVCDDNGEETYNPKLFTKILCGVYEIERKPWEPEEGEDYFHPNIEYGHVGICSWKGDTIDCILRALGMLYRTREEAEAHYAEDYEKLTGKKLK